jgi:hypothetical protein
MANLIAIDELISHIEDSKCDEYMLDNEPIRSYEFLHMLDCLSSEPDIDDWRWSQISDTEFELQIENWLGL